jgi:sugar lactone lactonase YvrE
LCTCLDRTEGKLRVMTLTKPLRLLPFALAAAFALSHGACTGSEDEPRTQGTAGTSAAGTGAAGTTGVAGTTGAAGTGAAGTGAAGTGAAGTGAAGTGGPAVPFKCPPGPFGNQMQTNSRNICNMQGFHRYGYNEGPTWIPAANAFFYSNFVQGNNAANKSAGDIIKVTMGAGGTATCERWLEDVGCNGLGLGANGKLIAACHGPRAVMEYDPATKAPRTIATMSGGKMFDSPNDLVAHSSGNIYFSNLQYELGGRQAGGLGSTLIRIDPAGVATVVASGGLNGLGLSPDEKLLRVVNLGVWNINADGTPGTKTNMGGPGGDGIAIDCADRATATGTNSAYGGPDGKTLISVGGGTSVRLIDVSVPGLP